MYSCLPSHPRSGEKHVIKSRTQLTHNHRRTERMRTTEQLKDSGGLAAIARMLKAQQQQQTTTTANENDEECNDDDEKEKRGEKRRRKEKKKHKKEKEKETKKEFKRKKTSSKSDDSDVNDDDAEDEKRRRKSKSEEEKEVSLESLLRRVDPVVMLDKNDDENDKMLKRIRAKLKCALEANVLHFSKRASGITKNASVTAERAHAWRQAVRGYGDEENDERGPGNVDSVLNVFKAMSDVLMAIVSVDSKCSDDDSDDESEIVKKYSPFASQLRALSTKAF